jgi:hypothetical protein
MVGAFIKIRFKQLYRGLIGIGLFRIVFLVLLFAYLLLFLFALTKKQPGSLYVVAATVFIILILHIRRKDKRFLKTCFEKHSQIYLSEYLTFTSIVILFLAVHLQWIALLVLLSAIFLIARTDIKPRHLHTLNTKLQSFIPVFSFEWKAGIRQSFFIFVPVWVIGFCTSFFIGSVPVALLILGITVSGFYSQNEPYQMVVLYEKSVNRFLSGKIGIQVILFGIVAFPLILMFIVFHPDKWYIPVIEFLVLTSIHAYLVLTKYAFYEPNRNSQGAQIIGAIGMLSMFIPVLLPVIWALSVLFYIKSQKNLNTYLHDFH